LIPGIKRKANRGKKKKGESQPEIKEGKKERDLWTQGGHDDLTKMEGHLGKDHNLKNQKCRGRNTTSIGLLGGKRRIFSKKLKRLPNF